MLHHSIRVWAQRHLSHMPLQLEGIHCMYTRTLAHLNVIHICAVTWCALRCCTHYMVRFPLQSSARGKGHSKVHASAALGQAWSCPDTRKCQVVVDRP